MRRRGRQLSALNCPTRPGISWPKRGRSLALSVWVLLGCVLALHAGPTSAQDGEGAVYVVPITGTIDLGLAPYLDRVLGEAEEDDAAAVLLEVDTPGGRLDAVLQMKDALLGADVRTIAFVDRSAFSAGALITIACETIYMAPGAALGAATPVDGGTGDTASEKVVSAVRKTFKATAEARGREPQVAEAMVDPDVEIDGLIERGKLLTLTPTEAEQWGYADDVLATREEVLAAAGLSGRPVVETSPSLAEDIVRFITNPVVASLLILAGLLLIIGDFFVEGLGIAAVAGAALLVAFFWGHMLAGLAGWEDIALVVLGIVLIGVEVFVIPGFGVAGVLGVAALLGGLFLAMLGRDIRSPEQMERAGLTVAMAFIAAVLGFLLILAFVPRTKRLGSLVLQAQVGQGTQETARPPSRWLSWFGGGTLPRSEDRQAQQTMPAFESKPAPISHSLVGETGVALTDLHPSGSVEINGRRIDVVTEGDYLSAGDLVEVVEDEGYRRVVRRAISGNESGSKGE
jgi:membrane-bound serine protease (ClpP class)